MRRQTILTTFIIALLTCLTPVTQAHSRELSSQPTASHIQEVNCLTNAVYFEARGEGVLGMKAVAYVTLNRTKDPRFPKTVCGVINQPGQFSWRNKGYKISSVSTWNFCKSVAEVVYWQFDKQRDPTNGALFFHSVSVSPNWGRPLKAKIGHHLFY